MSRLEEKGTHTTFMQESYIHCVMWIAVASSKGIYILYYKQQIKLKEQKTGSQNSPALIPNKINILKKTKANTDIHQKPLNQEKATVSFDKLQKGPDKERHLRFHSAGTCCQAQCQSLYDGLSVEEEHY